MIINNKLSIMGSWKNVEKQYLLAIGREKKKLKMTKGNTPKLFTRTNYNFVEVRVRHTVYLEKKSMQ